LYWLELKELVDRREITRSQIDRLQVDRRCIVNVKRLGQLSVVAE
jgi:hypothetical protein